MLIDSYPKKELLRVADLLSKRLLLWKTSPIRSWFMTPRQLKLSRGRNLSVFNRASRTAIIVVTVTAQKLVLI